MMGQCTIGACMNGWHTSDKAVNKDLGLSETSEERSSEETKVRPILIHQGPFRFIFGSGSNVAPRRHFVFSSKVGQFSLCPPNGGKCPSGRSKDLFAPGPGHCGHFQRETKIIFHPHILATVGQGSHLPSQTKTFLAHSRRSLSSSPGHDDKRQEWLLQDLWAREI